MPGSRGRHMVFKKRRLPAPAPVSESRNECPATQAMPSTSTCRCPPLLAKPRPTPSKRAALANLPFPTTHISTLHRALSQLHHCHTKSDPHGLRDVLKTTLSSEVSTVCVIFHLVASYTASQIHPPLISLPSALKVTVTSRHMNALYCEWLLQSPMLDGQHTHLYSFSNRGVSLHDSRRLYWLQVSRCRQVSGDFSYRSGHRGRIIYM